MRKVQFLAVFWTLGIAIPLTALALMASAYLTENLGSIIYTIQAFSRDTTAGGRGWILEFAQRWPEVAGMIVGQLVILVILVLVRRPAKAENDQKA
jgi:hypothetical protein